MANTNPLDAEAAMLASLVQASVLAVVFAQLDFFRHTHKVDPEVILLSSKLRVSFTVELMKFGNLPAHAAIEEPIWIGRVPIVYSKEIGDDYLVMRNKKLGAAITL